MFMLDANPQIYPVLEKNDVDPVQFFSHLNQNEPEKIEQFAITDLCELFASLRKRGLKIGVLTSDDRKSAEHFLAKHNACVDAMVCGNDGRGYKPTATPLVA